MDSPSLPDDLLSEEPLKCSLCLEVFTNPVSTPCGHSFCMACIDSYWGSCDICQCPSCSKRFHMRPEVNTNTVLEELAVQVKRRKVEITEHAAKAWEVPCDVCPGTKLKALKSCLVCLISYCEIHLEPHRRVESLTRHKLIDPIDDLERRICKKHQKLLEQFCRSDQTCVCMLCTETDHKTHDIVHIEEQYVEKKSQLDGTKANIQQMIQDRLKKVEEIKHTMVLTKEKMERQGKYCAHIFTEVVHSLEERKAKLLEVTENKQRAEEARAEELIMELEQEIGELQKRDTLLERLCHTEDHLHFLQDYLYLSTFPEMKKWCDLTIYTDLFIGTIRRAVSGVLEDVQKKVKLLTEAELKQLQKYKAKITMDPKTASSWVMITEGGKRMKNSKTEQVVPDNPERFETSPMVLGEQAFSSGRHYWEVQVGMRHNWKIGVAMETVKRKGSIEVSTKHGFFVLSMEGFGTKYSAETSPSTVLYLNPKPRKVGIYLDYEGGQVSFYDVEACSLIYTFAGYTFTGNLYPYFYLYSKAKKSEALTICDVYEYNLAFFSYLGSSSAKS
ncbi:zinc finger protein RFP-like [Scleropages formosus]|uniref:zinc finger protein RFP-like n=1 Tax=Scleropages formosus TaxID=113540 RepID=UPI0010FA82CB|nr:zinc finger protein RFP-like [Scleropages formosus]